MQRSIWLALSMLLVLAACSVPAAPSKEAGAGEPTAASGHMGMGMAGGMANRHRAVIPAPYAGVASPIASNAESVGRGAAVFTTNCAVCHGDGGMGDGPGGASLDPKPAPIAHSSQMMGDDYLFWRISEGGVPFQTAMPVWKEALSESARWDVINYVRALGKGDVAPVQAVGGAAYDAQVEVAQRTAMLAQAVAQNVITQADADTFQAVHQALDAYLAVNPRQAASGNPVEHQEALLAELVKAGTLIQAQAETFIAVHDKLHEAGLMQ